jgi:hypothetical protein
MISDCFLRNDRRREEGADFSISLLETRAVALVSEARAAFLTSALVSQMAPERVGTISGMSLAICSAEDLTRVSRRVRHPVLTCHFPAVSIWLRIEGRMRGVAQGEMYFLVSFLVVERADALDGKKRIDKGKIEGKADRSAPHSK